MLFIYLFFFDRIDGNRYTAPFCFGAVGDRNTSTSMRWVETEVYIPQGSR